MNPFKNIIAKFQSVKKIPQRMGFIVLDSINDNFKKQSFDGRPWKGKQLNDGRSLLVKSGKLRRSIRLAEASWRRIVISTDMPQAKIHNDGGEISVTAKMKKFFWAKYQNTQNPYWKKLALTKKQKLKIPQRRFMGVDSNTKKKLEKEFYNTFKNIFR